MGSAGGSLTSETGGGGLSVVSLSSGSTTDSSVKLVASVPGSADRGPGDLYCRGITDQLHVYQNVEDLLVKKKYDPL